MRVAPNVELRCPTARSSETTKGVGSYRQQDDVHGGLSDLSKTLKTTFMRVDLTLCPGSYPLSPVMDPSKAGSVGLTMGVEVEVPYIAPLHRSIHL
jgi:hypothetical protein